MTSWKMHEGLFYRIYHPENEAFTSGVLTIVTEKKGKTGAEVFCVNSRITLADIAKFYPDVKIVLFDGDDEGRIYRHKNWANCPDWVQYGKTIGIGSV